MWVMLKIVAKRKKTNLLVHVMRNYAQVPRTKLRKEKFMFKLTKVVKIHKKKDGKEFKKTHFYLYLSENVKVEILPNDFKQANGYYNHQCFDLLNAFAEKEDKE